MFSERSGEFSCLFFFQAEDGIRDDLVTGVQTCALPIWAVLAASTSVPAAGRSFHPQQRCGAGRDDALARRKTARDEPPGGERLEARHLAARSEERRVGKEGSDRRAGSHGEKKCTGPARR